MNPSQPVDKLSILMADDDEDDRELVRDVFHDGQLPGELTFVHDGQELIDYLRGKPPHRGASRPQIILLDLNMPRKDGHEALAEIKADDELCDIPVVVLTTSREPGRHPQQLPPGRELLHRQAHDAHRPDRCDA